METFFSVYEENINGVYVCYADVSGLDTARAERYLSEYRQNRVRSLKRIEDKRRSIGGELLLVYAIRKLYPTLGVPLDIMVGAYGKPQFCGDDKPLFSISHSGNVAVCAVAETNIGVDVERIDRISDAAGGRYFTADERKMAQNCGFARVWTRKEAAAKADGRGIGIGLDTIDVSGDTVVIGGERYRLANFDIKINGYAAALCVK